MSQLIQKLLWGLSGSNPDKIILRLRPLNLVTLMDRQGDRGGIPGQLLNFLVWAEAGITDGVMNHKM